MGCGCCDDTDADAIQEELVSAHFQNAALTPPCQPSCLRSSCGLGRACKAPCFRDPHPRDHGLLPPPRLRERCGRGLARRLIAIVVALAGGEWSQPCEALL